MIHSLWQINNFWFELITAILRFTICGVQDFKLLRFERNIWTAKSDVRSIVQRWKLFEMVMSIMLNIFFADFTHSGWKIDEISESQIGDGVNRPIDMLWSLHNKVDIMHPKVGISGLYAKSTVIIHNVTRYLRFFAHSTHGDAIPWTFGSQVKFSVELYLKCCSLVYSDC